jgi:hypothetical protein
MSDSDQAASAPPQRFFRAGLYLPFGIFLAIIVVWSGFWFYARHRAEQALDAWLALERVAGRDWSCPDRAIDGYPFRMQITCAKPSFTGPVKSGNGQPVQVTGKLGGFVAEALVYRPNQLIATLTGPLQVDSSDGRGATVTWRTLRASVEGKPGRLGPFSLVADEPVVTLAGAAEPAGRAKTLEVHIRPRPDGEAGAYDIAGTIEGAQLPLLDALAGTTEPARLVVRAQADKLAGIDGRNPPAALEDWRAAGGVLQIATLRFEKGAMSIEGAGNLAIDAGHFPSGQLETRVHGAEQLLARFGFGGNAMQIGGLLGSILGGGAQKEGRAAPGLKLTLRLSGGRAHFGPFAWPLKPRY